MKKNFISHWLFVLIPATLLFSFLLFGGARDPIIVDHPSILLNDDSKIDLIVGKNDYRSDEFPKFTLSHSLLRDPQIHRELQSFFQASVVGFSFDENIASEEIVDEEEDLLEVNENETDVFEVTYDEDEVEVTEAVVLNDSGEEVDMEIDQNGDEITVYPPEDTFRPGRYVLQVTLETSDGTIVSEEDFSWGVLTINADRSLYTLGQDAYLQMGVLDDAGHTICDADLELEITSPEGNVFDLSTEDDIVREVQCGPDNFISVPDYYANFSHLDEEGEYEMTLTATTQNGIHTVHDTFEVAADVAFDIRREAPTRIYPYEGYPVKMYITSTEDFEGVITEKVSSDFLVDVLSDAVEYDDSETVGEYTVLSWNVSMTAGQEIVLGYSFDAPDLSPEIFFLGTAKFTDPQDEVVFEETRRWQIASDATCVSAATGSWQLDATWTTCNEGSGTPWPIAGDAVTIQAAHVVTVNNANAAASVTINSPTTANGLTIGTSQSLTLTGALTFISNTTANTSLFSISGTATVGSISIPAMTGNGSSNITLNGAGALTVNGNGTPANGTLSIRSSSTAATTGATQVSVGNGSMNVSGLTTITGGSVTNATISVTLGTLTTGGGITFAGTAARARLTTGGASTINNTGTISAGGTVSMNLNSTLALTGTSAINGAYSWGNVTISSGTTTLGAATGVQGNFTNNSGTGALAGAFTLTMSGNTKTIGGTFSTTFNALTIGASALITANTSFTVTNALVLTGTISAAQSFTLGSSGVTATLSTVTHNQPTGAFTSAFNINAGTATLSGAYTIPSTSTTTTRIATIVLTTGTLNANGGMNTTGATGGSTAAVHVINMSGGAGNLNLKGAISTVSVAGAGGWTFTMGTAGSNFNYIDTSAQTVYFPGSGAYHNLVLNNTNASGVGLNAAITAANVTGNVTVGDGSSAAIFNDGQATTVGNAAKVFTVKNAATFNMTGTAAYPTGFGTFTYEATSTVNYKQTTAALTITNATYGHLGLIPAGTATQTFPSATLNVVGNITLGNGTNTATVVAAAANDVNIGGNWVTNANASFTHSSRTVTFNATTSGKTINNRVSSFYNVVFSGLGGDWTPVTNAMSVANTLTITTGTLNVASVNLTVTDLLTVNATLTQTTANISAKGIVVGASGSWTNTSTGDVALGTSGVSNSGAVTLDGTAPGCGDADAIALTGSSAPWSGSGTFSLTDLTVTSQAGSATLSAFSSTSGGGNGGNWSIYSTCAIPFVWDGGGATNNWSEAANWTNNTVPSSTATFNSTSTKDCTIDNDLTINGITISTGYTGTITQASGMTITIDSSYSQTAGTFTGGDSGISVWNFTQSGGTFNNSTAGTLIQNSISQTSGTFNPNSSMVYFLTNVNATIASTLYDLTIGIGGAFAVTLTGSINVSHDLFLTNIFSLNGGTLVVGGDVTSTDAGFTGNTALTLNGTGTQTITGSGMDFPGGRITINKTSGTAQLGSNVAFDTSGQDLIIDDGTLDMSTYNLTVADLLTVNADLLTQGSGNISAGTITVGASGQWVNASTGDVSIGAGGVSNAGTIDLNGGGVGCGTNDIQIRSSGSPTQRSWTGAGVFTLYDVDVQDMAGSASITVYSGTDTGNNGANWTFSSGCGVVSFTWDGGGATNNWSEDANWTSNIEPGVSDTAVFDSTSTKDCTVDIAISVGGVDINTGYTGTFTQSATLTVGSGNYDQNDGTFTGGSSAIDVNGSFTLSSGTFVSTAGDLSVSESLTQSGGTFTHNLGTVVLDGSGGTPTLSISNALNHVTFNNATGAYTVSGTLDVNGDLLFSALASVTGGTITVTGFVTSSDASFTGTTALTLDGSSLQRVDASSTDLPGGTVTFSNSGSGILLLSDLLLDTSGQDLTITDGNLDMGIFYLTVNDTLTINADKLIQGVRDVTAGTVVIGASGEWENLSTGDAILGAGGLANAGLVDFDSNGLGCGNDDIVIQSTSNGVQRTWSGAGTFSLYDVSMRDMATASSLAINVYSSTNTSNNDTDFSFIYPCGAILTVSSPTLATFPSLSSDTSIQTHNINFSSALQVQDGRNGILGFSLDVTTTNFIDGVKTIAYGNMDFKTGTASSPIGSSLTGITAPNQSYVAFSGGGATSTAITVLTSDTTRKYGVWEVTPNLQLRVPAYTSPGNYNATLTITIN